MGIIKQIKKMFSKNIDCAEALENSIFHFYTSCNRSFVVGANIIVPKEFCAVFVCKNKVTDMLPDGKFAISGVNMPKTYEKLKLAKAGKNGKYPKKFNADLYFIKTSICYGVDFNSFTKYVDKSKRYGVVMASSEGKFDLEIYDAKKLLAYLLKEYAYITDKLFLELLGGIVGDAVNDELTKYNQSLLKIITSPNEVYNYLNSTQENLFEYAGFKVSNVKLVSLNVKDKVREKIEADLNGQMKLGEEIKEAFDVSILHDEEKIDKEIPPKEVCEDMMDVGYTTCKVCGHNIKRSAKFCENCGADQNKF